MKINQVLESNLSWDEKFDEALKIYQTQCDWLDEQTKETIDKYYDNLKETLETVRHLHCMKELGYDPLENYDELLEKLKEV